MGLLNSTWTWVCGGIGVAALAFVITQTGDVNAPEQPVSITVEAPERAESSPREPEGTDEVEFAQASEESETPSEPVGSLPPPSNSESGDGRENVPDIVFEAPVLAPETSLVTSENNVAFEADRVVETPSAPGASAPPEVILVPPLVADSDIAELAVPDTAQNSGRPPAVSSAPAPHGASAPLTLAQVLPPGEAPQPGQIAPSFDLVRVAPDGSAVIAGRAEPNAQVQVFSGNVPVGEARASARGEFVVFITNPGEPTLDVRIPETPDPAQLVVSQDDIVILPSMSEEPDATPVVLQRTPDAVQIVQPSGPAIPSNVSLDLVSYSSTGSVVLAGRGQPQNTARIYANGELAGEVTIASGGDWRLEVDDIAEGRYVLRVDEISAEGAVLSRTESPFQREFPEAEMPESFSQGARIIVQPGNTLWLMATEAYGDGDAFTQIFSANSDAIRDPDLIYPGQIFSIPRLEE